MTKTTWDDVSYSFASSEPNSNNNNSDIVTSGSMTPIIIKSNDGRIIKANLHQLSRSVYPSFS